MSQNPFFRSSDSQTFMSHSFILALIYGLKVSYTAILTYNTNLVIRNYWLIEYKQQV